MRLAILMTIVLTGCSFGYKFTATGVSELKPRSGNCDFKVSYNQPGPDYEELGIVEWVSGSAAGTVEQFKKAVSQDVCRAGGDLVVLNTQTRHGNINAGTVYRKKL